MSEDAERGHLRRVRDAAGPPQPRVFQEAAGEAEAEAARDAFLKGAGPRPEGLAESLSGVDSASRERAIGRLQQERGNAYVQRVIGSRFEALRSEALARPLGPGMAIQRQPATAAAPAGGEVDTLDGPLDNDVRAAIGRLIQAFRNSWAVTAAPRLLDEYLQLRPSYVRQRGAYKAAVAGLETTRAPFATQSDVDTIKAATAGHAEITRIRSDVSKKSADLRDASNHVSNLTGQSLAHLRTLRGLQDQLDAAKLTKLVHDNQVALKGLTDKRDAALKQLTTMISSPFFGMVGEIGKLGTGSQLEKDPDWVRNNAFEDFDAGAASSALNVAFDVTGLSDALARLAVPGVDDEIKALQTTISQEQATADQLQISGVTQQMAAARDQYRILTQPDKGEIAIAAHRLQAAAKDAKDGYQALADAVNRAVKSHGGKPISVLGDVGTSEEVVARFDGALAVFRPTVGDFTKLVESVLGELDPPPRSEEVTYNRQELTSIVTQVTLDKLQAQDDGRTFEDDEKMAQVLRGRAGAALAAVSGVLPGKWGQGPGSDIVRTPGRPSSTR